MSDCASQSDNLFHQLTLNSALTDALTVLYKTNKSDNEYINKFLQLYKPICQKINQTKVSIKSFEPILDKPFAKGAFGKVTIVKSTADRLVYAMKIIKKSRLISQMDRATPMEERLILSHPNEEWLPQLHASFQDDKYLYLVMEYTPGGDLGGLIDRKQIVFTEDVARFYIAELVLAIERVHQLGYMHRDIKPGNILIDKMGHIKLGDLGSCIAVDTEEPLSMVGTAFYMSPEMFNSCGNTKRNYSAYGKEVDWWSVGVVLYELLVISNSINTLTAMKCQYKPLSLKGLENSINNDPKTTLSHEAKDLILRLLSTKPDRLGYNGVDEIKSHPFFKSINWNTLHTEEKPSFIPEITSVEDTKYFSESCEEEEGYIEESDSDDDDDSDDESLDDEEEENDLVHEFPFIGYTFTERFTGELTKKMNSINKNLQKTEVKEPLKVDNTEMKERIQLLEKENEALLKVKQQQNNDLNELYPLKEQVKQLQEECQTLLDKKASLYSNIEKNSKELEKVKLQLDHEKQGFHLKEQQWLKQLNSLKDQNHQNERLIKIKEEENNTLLGQLKESRDKIDSLRNELEETKKRFDMLHDSKPRNLLKPKIKHYPVEEDRSVILTAMWERDQQQLKILQSKLNLSQDKLAKSNLQVIRLKKELQYVQKSKPVERQKSISTSKKIKLIKDAMEGPMELSFDSSHYRPFYLKLKSGVLEILDKQNRNSQSIIDLRSMLSSVSLSPEGVLAIRTKEHSQSTQDLQSQLKREKDFMTSTQRTLAIRARLNRKKNEFDSELENALKRTAENISLLEKELENKRNHVLLSGSNIPLSCCRCVSEKQGVSTCQNCHHAFHPDCALSAPDCIDYQELMATVPLLLKAHSNSETMKWYHAIQHSISSESSISQCI